MCSRRKCGLTLTETLATLALLVIVSGVLVEISLGSFRIFAQTRAEAEMRSNAELLFEKVVTTVRKAMTINQLTASTIDVTVPARDSNGKIIVGYSGVQAGNRVVIFRGDSLGSANASGLYLWQSVNGVVATAPMGAEFSNCQFNALTVGGATKGVQMILTYSTKVLGSRTVSDSFTQEVTCRNLP